MSTNHRSWVIASLVLSAATMVTACGRPAGNAAENQQEPARESAPQASRTAERRQDACALIDRADIEQIAGVKLSMLHEIVDEQESRCELRKEDPTALMIMAVTVYWTGGKEKARIDQAGRSMARQLLNDGEVNIDELTGSQKIKGLADKAFFNDLLPSWVLKDDVFIEFITPTLGHEQTLKAFMVAAKKALARLPDQVPRR